MDFESVDYEVPDCFKQRSTALPTRKFYYKVNFPVNLSVRELPRNFKFCNDQEVLLSDIIPFFLLLLFFER